MLTLLYSKTLWNATQLYIKSWTSNKETREDLTHGTWHLKCGAHSQHTLVSSYRTPQKLRIDRKDFVLCSTAPFFHLCDLTRFTDPAENTHFFVGLALHWVSELNQPCEAAGEHRSWHKVSGSSPQLQGGKRREMRFTLSHKMAPWRNTARVYPFCNKLGYLWVCALKLLFNCQNNFRRFLKHLWRL